MGAKTRRAHVVTRERTSDWTVTSATGLLPSVVVQPPVIRFVGPFRLPRPLSVSPRATGSLLREILSRTRSCRTSEAVPCIRPGNGPPGVDLMPGQPALHSVDEKPAGIRSAQRARAGDRAHRPPQPLGRRAALTLNRPVGAADPQRRLVGVAVHA